MLRTTTVANLTLTLSKTILYELILLPRYYIVESLKKKVKETQFNTMAPLVKLVRALLSGSVT